MSKDDDLIVIKKINKGGHGHHGGAWKVAYADFVTAMMAFFLLMWLLNATEAEQLAGLADFFAPTTGVKDEMGIGFRGGKAALSEGIGADLNTNKGIIFGGVPTGPMLQPTEKIDVHTEQDQAEKISVQLKQTPEERLDEEEDIALDDLRQSADAMSKTMEQAAADEGIQNNADISVTPQGIEIDIKDADNDSMFEDGTAVLKPKTKNLLRVISQIVQRLPNYIVITGHARLGAVKGRMDYGTWELSADRANATRRFMIELGVTAERIIKIVGRADMDPLDSRNPAAYVNSRVTLLLLREGTLPSHKKASPERLFRE